MPLRDWGQLPNWAGMRHLWITKILEHVVPRLPSPYRAILGTVPALELASGGQRPDLAVTQRGELQNDNAREGRQAWMAPDDEMTVATLDIAEPAPSLLVERAGRLVAVAELISPRNKDRPSAREYYASRYIGYLRESIHLLLVDVHAYPKGFSWIDRIAQEFSLPHAACPAPQAAAYRVGLETEPRGRRLASWRRPLSIQSPLPVLPLPLDLDLAVLVDLEASHMQAAHFAYLD